MVVDMVSVPPKTSIIASVTFVKGITTSVSEVFTAGVTIGDVILSIVLAFDENCEVSGKVEFGTFTRDSV